MDLGEEDDGAFWAYYSGLERWWHFGLFTAGYMS